MSHDVCLLFHALSCACIVDCTMLCFVEHDVDNLRKIRRCWMPSNTESHSQVIEVMEKPHYSMATVSAANSAEEAIQAFLFGPDCIIESWKRLRWKNSYVMATRILLKCLSPKHVILWR